MAELQSHSLIPVAQYVRMSTEHQNYSIDNQRAAIAEYAASHGMAVVRTYADDGVSGVTMAHRDALKSLLQDVSTPERGFELLLVYDISRWGRFQDTDESAYYEHVLRRCGVPVVYCAEPFENDGSPMSTIIKSVKRAMAAEYSRELSDKVSRGKRRMAERGFRSGSHAGYGLRRLAVSESGAPRMLLQRGERKSMHTDRIILVPGPAEEVAIVQRIFALYVRARLGPKRIARRLAEEGAPLGAFKRWNPSSIGKILTSEKYIGLNVYGKQARRLGGTRVNNAAKDWVRITDAFEPIVDRAMFDAAQGMLRRRRAPQSDEEMLEGLRALERRAGAITGALIAADPELHGIPVYRRRFGKLTEAYKRIGYTPSRKGGRPTRYKGS